MTLYPTESSEPVQALDGIDWEGFNLRLEDAPAAVIYWGWLGDFDPTRWLWCNDCCRVSTAGRIFFVSGECWCPNCEAPAACLFWWDSWPKVAIPNWIPEPLEGTYYFPSGAIQSSLDPVLTYLDELPYEYKQDEKRFLTSPPPGYTHDGRIDPDEQGELSDDGGAAGSTTEPVNLPTGAEAAAPTP